MSEKMFRPLSDHSLSVFGRKSVGSIFLYKFNKKIVFRIFSHSEHCFQTRKRSEFFFLFFANFHIFEFLKYGKKYKICKKKEKKTISCAQSFGNNISSVKKFWNHFFVEFWQRNRADHSPTGFKMLVVGKWSAVFSAQIFIKIFFLNFNVLRELFSNDAKFQFFFWDFFANFHLGESSIFPKEKISKIEKIKIFKKSQKKNFDGFFAWKQCPECEKILKQIFC